MAYSTSAPRINKTVQYNPYAQTVNSYDYGINSNSGLESSIGNTQSSGDGLLSGIADNAGNYINAGVGALNLVSNAFGNFNTDHLNDRELAEMSSLSKDSRFDTSFHKENLSIIEGVNPGKTDPLGQTLSGAGSGASIGSVIPGIGTAIGAGIGGLIGGVTSLFGNRRKKKKAARLKRKLKEEANLKLENYADRFDDVLESRHQEELTADRLNKIRSRYMGVPASFSSFA